MSLKLLPPIFIFYLVAAFSPSIHAELISVNFTDDTTSAAVIDDAILGDGTWNQMADESPSSSPLLKSDGSASSITLVVSSTSGIQTNTQVGNSVQSESWSSTAPAMGATPPITCSVSGLLNGQVFQVAVYLDREGTGAGNTDDYTVNGTTKSTTTPGEQVVPLPGVADLDYLLFTATASVTGQITIEGPSMAAVQIQGILDDTEDGPKLDGRITKLAFSNGGRGNDRYIVGFSRSQSITQQAKRRQTKRYFANFENEGKEIDRCFFMAFANKRQAKLTIKDRDTRKNVTARALRKNYRYLHEKGQTRRFEISVKPLKKRGTIKTRVSAVSSTKVRSNQDSVTAVTKVRK